MVDINSQVIWQHKVGKGLYRVIDARAKLQTREKPEWDQRQMVVYRAMGPGEDWYVRAADEFVERFEEYIKE